MSDQHHYTIVYPSESLEGQAGWTAKSYDPIQEEWAELGAWYPTQQGAIDEAETRFRELMREEQVVQILRSIIEDLRQKGFSLAEILNAWAELAHRDSYPNQVGYFLEEASKAAE